jgi:hypothetical protein
MLLLQVAKPNLPQPKPLEKSNQKAIKVIHKRDARSKRAHNKQKRA